MITLLLIAVIGFIAGVLFVAPALKEIPYWQNRYNKKVQRHNIKMILIAGLIGAIIFPLIFGL